jgi:hypothetical protein
MGAAFYAFVIVAVLVAAVSAIASAQDAGALAGWTDGEIRRTSSPATHTTDVFVAVLPPCTNGRPTLTLRATFRGSEPTIAPASIEVRANIGASPNPTFRWTRTLTFVVDSGTRETASIDLSPGLHAPLQPAVTPGELLDTGVAAMSLPDFVQLLTAKAVTVDVLGLTCRLNSSEIEALRRFAAQVLPARH